MFLKSLGLTGLLLCCATAVTAVQTSDIRPTTAIKKTTSSVSDLVSRIQKDNPAVQAAKAALDVARARVEAAKRPLYNPDLEFETESSDVRTTTLGLNQTIDWSDKQGVRLQIAQKELLLAEVELSFIQRQVANDVLNNLVRYQIARKLRMLAVRRTRIMKDFANTAELLQQAGDVNQLDLALARVAYTEASMQQGSVEASLVTAEAALRAVSGSNEMTWPELPDDLPILPASIDLKAMLDHIPELVISKLRVERSKAQITLAEREGRADPTIGVWGGKEDKDTLLGVRFEIPLFVRNSYKAETRMVSQQALQTEQLHLEKYRRAKARLEGALASYRIAISTWKGWLTTGQTSLIEQVSLLDKLWKSGEISATNYLIQASQNVDTQITAVELTEHVWLAAMEWLDASGAIDDWLAGTMGDEKR